MFEACFNKLEKVAGRAITKAEREQLRADYEARALQAMNDPTMPPANAMQAAFAKLVADAEHAKKLSDYRSNLRILAAVKLANNAEAISVNAGVTRTEAVSRMITKYLDNRTGVQSVEERADGIYQYYSSALAKIGNALGSQYLGLMERKSAVNAFIKYTHGEPVDPKAFPDLEPEVLKRVEEAAQSTQAMFETLRQRANKAGADIGKLLGGYLPHSWDNLLVSKVTQKEFIDDLMARVDRSRMTDAMGVPLDDKALVKLFGDMYRTVKTDGMNKGEIAPPVGGSIANRGSQSRVVHFKDSTAWMEMAAKYSGEQLGSVINGHVRGMSRNIALMEQFGPNPEKLINDYLATAKKADLEQFGDGVANKLIKKESFIKAQYAVMSGTASTVQNANVARFFQGWRNLNTMKLAGAAVTSFTADPVQYRSALILHNWDQNMPMLKRINYALGAQVQMTLQSTKLLLSKGARQEVETAGLASEVMTQTLYRNAEDMTNAGWTRAVSDVTMRASLLGHLTNARREGFRVLIMKSFFDKVKKYDYADMGDLDAKLIKGGGITQTHWDVFKLANGEDLLGHSVLSPKSIDDIPDDMLRPIAEREGKRIETVRRDAREALLGFMTSEDKLGVMEPNMTVQAQKMEILFKGQVKRGAIRDELTLNFYQFKAFPHAYMTQIIGGRSRMFGDGLGRYGYIGAMVAASTLFGAMNMQIKSMLSGRDPENMDPTENKSFWSRALLSGGGLGFYGDFLKAETNWQGQVAVEGVLGPANTQGLMYAGSALGLGGVPFLDSEEDQDKKVMQIADRTVRDVKTMLPTNLWYTRAITDRIIFNNIGEYLKPGYVQRIEERARDMYGQEHFWSLEGGAFNVERAPKMSEAPRNEN